MTTESTPGALGSNDHFGPLVKAWYCVYSSGQEFVSTVEYPMNDPNMRECWRIFSMAERDAAVAAERERCAKLCTVVAAQLCDVYGDGAECIATGDACAAAIRGAADTSEAVLT